MSELRKIPEIKTVMTKSPQTVGFEQSLLEAEQMMNDFGTRHLPVVQGERLVGMMSDRDLKLVREIERRTDTVLKVGNVCSTDIYTVAPEAKLDEVVSGMVQARVGSAMVVEHGNVVGIFTTVDVCRCFADFLREQHERDISDALHL